MKWLVSDNNLSCQHMSDLMHFWQQQAAIPIRNQAAIPIRNHIPQHGSTGCSTGGEQTGSLGTRHRLLLPGVTHAVCSACFTATRYLHHETGECHCLVLTESNPELQKFCKKMPFRWQLLILLLLIQSSAISNARELTVTYPWAQISLYT